MVRSSALAFRRTAAAAALCAAASGFLAVPAQARVFVGVGIGVPFFGPGFFPGPYYYPPPVYYVPPPVYYTPPQTYSPPVASSSGGQSCYAGQYVCPMERPTTSGASCYCPGGGGQRVWGRAS